MSLLRSCGVERIACWPIALVKQAWYFDFIGDKGMCQRFIVYIAVAGLTMLNITMSVSAGEIGEHAESISGREKIMAASNELELRGKQLRAEIDSAYKKLSDARAIKNQGMGRNFITDVVIKYIPVGTSFDDAETILRAAGFTIQPRLPNPYLSDAEKYDERATIDQYVPTPFGKTSVDISLRPRGPDDYSTVQNITAEITRTFP